MTTTIHGAGGLQVGQVLHLDGPPGSPGEVVRVVAVDHGIATVEPMSQAELAFWQHQQTLRGRWRTFWLDLACLWESLTEGLRAMWAYYVWAWHDLHGGPGE